MSETIKLNEGIEGAEVRDALKWVKHITEDDINRMKIGRTGFLFSFIDSQHVIAGKVFIPSTGELWHSEKEVGFNCKRLLNAFSIFKRRDKTELYINENRLFLKNGGLKWRYDMEEVEQAAKIDFSNIPTPSIRINIRDILPLKSINKGKKVSEKLELVGFKYGGGKATMFVSDSAGNNRIDLGEVATEGEGEGIALYNLVFLEKLLKNAKSGFMRIEEGKALKLNVYTGKATKAVLYLAPLLNSDLTEEIRGEGAPSSPAPDEETNKDKWLKEEVAKDNLVIGGNEREEIKAKAELDKIQEQEQIEQEKNRGFREAVYKSEIVSVCFFNYLEGTKDAIYRDQEGHEYQSNALNFDTLAIDKIKELKRIDKADAAEQVEREKLEQTFKETEQAVKDWGATFKGPDKEGVVRKEVIKEGVSFLTVREANGAAFHNSKEVYEDMKAEAEIDRECMWVLHLVGGKVLKKELVGMGKGNTAIITPREVYRRAIIEGATKIVMVHNHPSGDPTPSDSDIAVCETYTKAGKLLGIEVLDFLVIGTQGYSSFADKGIGGF
jgi:DNA repair protein RadC